MARIASDALRQRQDIDRLDRREQIRSDLVGLLYDAAADPALWSRLLEALSAALGGAALLLTLRPASHDDAGSIVATGIAADFQRSFSREASSTIDWLPWAIEVPPGAVINLRDVLPQRQLVRTSFYADWMRPQGLLPAPVLVAVILTERSTPAASLIAFRPWGGGALGTTDVMLLRWLMPHLQRAIVLHQERREIVLERRAMASALAGVGCRMIIVDRDAHLVRTLRSDDEPEFLVDGLAVSDDELHAELCEETPRLHALIAAAACSRGRLRGPLLIRRTGQPPLRVAAVSAGEATESIVTLFVTDPDQRGDVAMRGLRERYRLTPTEASICTSLIGGRSITESAALLGMRVSTARTHLRQIFCKTGTNRQAALVQRLLTEPAQL